MSSMNSCCNGALRAAGGRSWCASRWTVSAGTATRFECLRLTDRRERDATGPAEAAGADPELLRYARSRLGRAARASPGERCSASRRPHRRPVRSFPGRTGAEVARADPRRPSASTDHEPDRGPFLLSVSLTDGHDALTC